MVSLTADRLTIEEVAAAVGRSRQMLHRYANTYGVDIHSIEAVQAHIAEHGGKVGAAGVSDELKAAKALAEVEKLEQEGRSRKIDNDLKEGKLVNRDVAERRLSQACAAISARLQCAPGRIIVSLPGESRGMVFELLSEDIRKELIALADLPAEILADEEISDV